MKTEIFCSAIIVNKFENEIKVMLLNNNNEWCFPKTRVESDSNELDSTINETFKVSKIKLNKNECLGEICEYKSFDLSRNLVKISKFYAFKIENNQEIDFDRMQGFLDGRWVDISGAIILLNHEDMKNALKKTIEKLKI